MTTGTGSEDLRSALIAAARDLEHMGSRISAAEEDVRTMRKRMFEGNGGVAVVVLLNSLQTHQKALEKRVADLEADRKRLLVAVFVAVGAALLSLVVGNVKVG